MQKGKVFIPTEEIPELVKESVIFLAGPIQGTDDWQSKAIEITMSKSSGVVIANPRRKYLDGEFDYQAQVDWETKHLKRAAENGVILFWLARELDHDCGRSYAQTTRAELFEWKVRHECGGVKLVIGIEDGFSGARYIRRRFEQDCPDVLIFDTLDATCLGALELL